MEKRPYGNTGWDLSILGFGGIIVMDVSPADADTYVGEAIDRGINYFDVAPSYGNAEERLGPALKPYRDSVFLACKTGRRDAAGAMEELENSLRLMQTDHFDLYQLHAITTDADVSQAFGPGGAMETFLKAREQGKVKHLGFSAHSVHAALSALSQHSFDSILFPFNYITYENAKFSRSRLRSLQPFRPKLRPSSPCSSLPPEWTKADTRFAPYIPCLDPRRGEPCVRPSESCWPFSRNQTL